MNLPFRSFLDKVDTSQPVVKEPATPPEILHHHEEPVTAPASNSHLQDIILLDDDSDEEAVNDDPKSADDKMEQNEDNVPVAEQLATEPHTRDVILLDDDDSEEEAVNDDPMSADEKSEHNEGNAPASSFEGNKGDVTMSLSDLSSSFKKCLKSTNQMSNGKQAEKSQDSVNAKQFKPFDYEAARKEITFGDIRGINKGEEGEENGKNRRDVGNRKKSSVVGRPEGGEESGGFQLGRRRQAFPSTGNRSASYR